MAGQVVCCSQFPFFFLLLWHFKHPSFEESREIKSWENHHVDDSSSLFFLRGPRQQPSLIRANRRWSGPMHSYRPHRHRVMRAARYAAKTLAWLISTVPLIDEPGTQLINWNRRPMLCASSTVWSTAVSWPKIKKAFAARLPLGCTSVAASMQNASLHWSETMGRNWRIRPKIIYVSPWDALCARQ